MNAYRAMLSKAGKPVGRASRSVARNSSDTKSLTPHTVPLQKRGYEATNISGDHEVLANVPSNFLLAEKEVDGKLKGSAQFKYLNRNLT